MEPREAALTEEETLTRREKLILTLRFLKIYWKILFAVTWALILIPPLLVYNYKETRCAYAILMMAGYWITECFPMAVTSLIPVVLFPAFGVLSTADTCGCYVNDTIMVFIGGLVLAIAIEHSNLHLRIALGVMRTVGCTHGKLLGGLCAVTAFISMWVSNTAATAMMVPIIFAVLNELEQAGYCRVYDELPVPPGSLDPPEKRPTRITTAYLLAAAYCSTFGGINFTQWMIASLPQMIVNTFLTWFYLRVAYLGYLRPHSKDAEIADIGVEGEMVTNQVIEQRYKELGSIKFHEGAVAGLFLTCIFLWLFRKPGFVTGWAEVITDIDLRDSVPVIFVSIMMFFIPKDFNFLRTWSKDPAKRPFKSSEGLITWDVIQRKMPWSLMFLLGGGFAISRGSMASGLAKKIGETLVPLRYLPAFLIMLIVCFFIGTITEFTSNVGIANITLPVIAQMCVAMEMHPMYLMVPATISCSFSFRLPVGTPPNAIITVVGNMPTQSLMIGGCVPSIYGLIINCINFVTWGMFIHNIKEFPAWATSGYTPP
ncbi:hypothetical protein QLX08_010380 [Tetragonisca angustula]|uniref:Protein I'm not dead yet n=1 Tax=Tetragonisca angustula TaxID=166442 RepID=A0AAW0ZCI6_9HYME